MKILKKGTRPKSWWEGMEITCDCGTTFILEAGDIKRDREFEYVGFRRVGEFMRGCHCDVINPESSNGFFR